MVITQDIYKINTKNVYKKFINLCQHANMYEHVMVETLLGTLNAIWGVTYITCCYTLTLPLSECLHLLFCVLYNVVLENHSVRNSPLGGGGGGL